MRKKPVVYLHRYEKLGVSLWRARFPENTSIELKRRIYREVNRENERRKDTAWADKQQLIGYFRYASDE